MVVMVSALQKLHTGGGVDDIGIGKGIGQKFLQTGTGEDDDLGRLDGLHLPDGEGIVMKTGNVFRHQTIDIQPRALCDAAGELPHRQGGGGDLCPLGCCAAPQAQTKQHG